MYPDNFRYTKEHEWVLVEADNGTVGITDHAQHELGDIVYVDLPKIGAKTEKGVAFGSVESVKAVSEIFAPVSGEVVAINEELANAPEKLNEDPHGAGWLVKIKLVAPGETKDLMTAAEYQSYIGAES
jgi:glycine cleavage system H protein